VLAGHGSHISPETAGLVWDVADRIRALGVVHEVAAAFWKEQPSFHDVLRSIEADDITVIPVFTARGFFTQEVIPAEMGLTGPLTLRDGKTIRYTKTLSETPFLNEVASKRVRDALRQHNSSNDERSFFNYAVAIIGHGTKRNKESRTATEACAQYIRDSVPLREVVSVYLDDEPPIAAIPKLTRAPFIIAVPFFLAKGSHVTVDLRRELDLAGGSYKQFNETDKGRRYNLLLTNPVGEDSTLADALLSLAREAETPFRACTTRLLNEGLPASGRRALWDEVNKRGEMIFGQCKLTPTFIEKPIVKSVMEQLVYPTHRNLARLTETGFRPLASARDFPKERRRFKVRHATDLHHDLETLYPGAVADWALARQGKFIPNMFEACIGRQVGQFKQLEGLAQEKRADLVSRICGRCIKHPSWFDGEIGEIPCAEPCNFWLSAALREHAGKSDE